MQRGLGYFTKVSVRPTWSDLLFEFWCCDRRGNLEPNRCGMEEEESWEGKEEKVGQH